ncbi:MAG TPA: glycosyltransferase family 1 protein [Polyangiaceae bacterium]|nr:glycosyltransferase family 1 protein [Polyangiaceae bacterium]
MREPTECPFALSTSGCDFGNSGVGVFAREVVPRLVSSLHRRGLRSILVGSRAERIGIGVDPSSGFRLPSALDAPGPNALFAFAALPLLARAARARALYLPAANRRVVALPTVPTVGTVHDLAQFHVENKYGRARDLYVRRILTPTLRRLSLVLAVSEATADDVTALAGVPRSRIRVVHNGISLPRPERPLPPWPHPYLLYPARLEHPGKNHLALISAFSRSRARLTHDLLLTGKNWGAQTLIEDAIRRQDLSNRVHVLGYLSRSDLVGRMAAADGIVVAGLFEGFGLQAAEALALGIPVAVSNTGSLPEVAGGLAASFDPRDVDSIARGLDAIVSDPLLRARCRDLGPVHSQRFSWDRCAEAVVDALIEVGSP